MARCYIEVRKGAARGTESVVADVMRHLHTRQHLGRATLVCEPTLSVLSAARKQWLKLSRSIQKQRASTLNADKILKYTHMITHMQRMHFTAKTPLENPSADIYLLEPAELAIMPIHCWTVYVLTPVPRADIERMLRLLPPEALVVDYTQATYWDDFGLQPKHLLEQQVDLAWQRISAFLKDYSIDITAIAHDDIRDVEAMDDALDVLLGMSYKFLQVANDFQRALELARPLRISRELRAEYDALVLLAHRVQALSPGAFTQQFLETYNEDDTFFLYDPAAEQLASAGTLAEAYARHVRAGRHQLARALQDAWTRRSLPYNSPTPPGSSAATNRAQTAPRPDHN